MVRRPLRTVLRPFLLLVALAWVPWAILWAVNLEGPWRIAAFEGFAHYVIVLTLLAALLALVLKARVVALIAVIGLVVLVYPRAGRVLGADQPRATGPTLVVASANVRFGKSDTAFLARLVKRERIDVLALQENTIDTSEGLRAAGLASELPYVVDNAQPGAAGISVYSRVPITATAPGPTPPGKRNTRSIGGALKLENGTTVQVRSVHPPPPVSQKNLRCWKRCTREYPAGRSGGVFTILAGDFNATLDHHPLRELMADGNYRDAAAETGDGWRPTWSNGRWARLTIDHVLVPRGVAVQNTTVHDQPGSDHDVVVTRLRLPR